MRIIGHVPTKVEVVMRVGYDFVEFVEIDGDEPLPEGTTVTWYFHPRDSDDVLAFWPSVLVEPGGAQIQILADDHAVIPDGARVTVALQKPGYPKTPWFEGRVSKANR